jgi:hypothetical protein
VQKEILHHPKAFLLAVAVLMVVVVLVLQKQLFHALKTPPE